MIDKEKLISKLGKRGFTEFVANNKSNEPTGYDRTRGIRGRVRFRMCEHGKWVIEEYVPKVCKKCQGVQSKQTKGRDFKPYFNLGLGAFVESRQEERSLAKSKGYVEAG